MHGLESQHMETAGVDDYEEVNMVVQVFPPLCLFLFFTSDHVVVLDFI